MWNFVFTRRYKSVAFCCVILVCILCLYLYFTCVFQKSFHALGRTNTPRTRVDLENVRGFSTRNTEKMHRMGTMYPARVEKPDILIEGMEGDDEEEEDYSRPYSEFEVGRERGDVIFHKNANTHGVLPRRSDISKDVLTLRETISNKALTSGGSGSVSKKILSEKDQNNKTVYSPPAGEIPKKRLPHAIVIGTGKCGTRALLEYLKMHPCVSAPRGEIHFFDRDENFDRGLTWYKDQMPDSYSNQITIEKSPSYVEHPRAAREIYKMNRTIKLVWVVKDPVVRLMSVVAKQNTGNYDHFYLKRINGALTINTKNHAIRRGKYILHLKKWLRFFDLSQIHIVDGGALRRDPANEIQHVQAFLKLPRLIGANNFYYNATRGFYCLAPLSGPPKCLGNSKGRKHPELKEAVKILLYNMYKPFNEQFFKAIGKRFNWEIEDYT